MTHFAGFILLAGAMLFGAPGIALADAADSYAVPRAQLIREITAMAAQDRAETGRPSISPRVMEALARVPRHKFVPTELERRAYENRPLPIGYGQTISQPYVVALMTELLQVKAGDKVLEIGTGSGYQAAMLAELTDAVFSIEIIEPLAERALATLGSQGYGKVQVRVGDGYYGWPEHAPFDAIVVTAAASHVPPPLIQQLKPGGRMVIPLGSAFMTQQLMLVEKDAQGRVLTREILPVAFVPLTGKH
jgi:protein-L-isoaspartate(D-aspartate) O-methyltransferase